MSQSSESRRSAFITGASKGIGYAVAQALAQAGYGVSLTSRNAQEVQQAAQQITQQVMQGGQNTTTTALGHICDVRDPQALQDAVNAHVRHFGSLDVLFINAGVGRFAPLTELSLEDWQQVIDTNLSGSFYTLKVALPALKERGGYVFTLSSLAGRNPFEGGGAYNASKFGLNGLSEVMMLELRQYGIKVTQIMPGSVSTHFNGHTPDQHADAWKIQPEDIAQLTLDLLRLPANTLPSRIEVRPARPAKKS